MRLNWAARTLKVIDADIPWDGRQVLEKDEAGRVGAFYGLSRRLQVPGFL